jgi:CheY-like chemotaxis protein
MSVKRLLYIDDNKIESQIENLRKKLKRLGHELDETFLHLNDDFRIKEEGSGKIILNKAKIQAHITENYINENFDIIASDYDFKDSNLDGFTLLKWIKNESDSKKYRLRRARFCLYSAEQDKVAKEFNTPEQVKKLIKLKIDDFIDRSRIPEEITQLLIAPQKSYYFKEHIVGYLEKHGDKVFKSAYPKFKGKTLSEIANEIDKDLPNGIEFQKCLVELTVAHLVELNDLEAE